MATQRITIAKIGGVAADVVLERLKTWSAARRAVNPNEWSCNQWSSDVLAAAADFATSLRVHQAELPVVHFVEWIDMWSFFDEIPHKMTPPDGPYPYSIHAKRIEIYGYGLPDDRRLLTWLESLPKQQFTESELLKTRFIEAVRSWDKLVPRAALIALREALDVSVSDEQVVESQKNTPPWLV